MSSRSFSSWGVIALALALGAAGCGEVFVGGAGGGSGGEGAAPEGGGGSAGQSGGQGGTTSEGGRGPACDAPAPTSACAACLFENCEGRYCDCTDEPKCPDLIVCVLETETPALEEICLQNNEAGISPAVLLQLCGNMHCPAECAFEPVQPCLACQAESCPEQTNACLAFGECLAFFKCVEDCVAAMGSLTMCSGECSVEHPDGADVAGELLTCSGEPCGAVCPF
jgi:hypothetical protein